MRRLFLFAHFDRDDLVDQYVLEYLSALAQLGSIIFISTSRLRSSEIAKVRRYTLRALSRPNVGYDFMSWQLGLKLVEGCGRYDEIVICNDSVYAPIFPLAEMFEVMEQSPAPYWGVTSNSQIARHIQSYFAVFRRPVLERMEFWQFWENVRPQQSKNAVIEAYEVGLSRALERLGLFGETYFSLDGVLNDALMNLKSFSVLPLIVPLLSSWEPMNGSRLLTGEYNKTLILWRELILARVPMLKVQLLREHLSGEPSENVLVLLEKYTSYPVHTIRSHLERMHNGEPL
jgi:rhamnosyltransferase